MILSIDSGVVPYVITAVTKVLLKGPFFVTITADTNNDNKLI